MVSKFTSTVFSIGLTVGGHSTVVFDVFKYSTLFHIAWNCGELKYIKAPHVLV